MKTGEKRKEGIPHLRTMIEKRPSNVVPGTNCLHQILLYDLFIKQVSHSP
jgi:hypothetical protein